MAAGARSYLPASAAMDLWPPFGPASGEWDTAARRDAVRASMSAPSQLFPMKRMPYGGSVTIASTLFAGSLNISVKQSPWMMVYGALMPPPPTISRAGS